MNDRLQQRWHSSVNCLVKDLHSHLQQSHGNEATSHLDITSSVSNKWLNKVEYLYNESHRAYHNMAHVEDVLNSLDLILSERTGETNDVDIMATLDLAAFFHDVIYNPKSSTNEKDSAELFLEFAGEISNVLTMQSTVDFTDTTAMVSQIQQCIIATATHIKSANEARQSENILTATFLDADMSILGRDASRYDTYAGCIRKEYEFVERSMYCEKRAEILESFLPVMKANDTEEVDANTMEEDANEIDEGTKQHLFIYATERGRELWEVNARENLQREIGLLKQGVIPCEEKS